MGVKDNSLPSFLNQMQIKLKAVEQQIPPLTVSLETPTLNPLSLSLPPPFIPLFFPLLF